MQPVANETIRVGAWLYSVLSADSTLAGLVSTRIYSYLAPDGSALPFVTYSYQGGRDVIVIGGVRIMNSGLYQVKVVTQSNSMVGATETIATRIDDLLTRATGTVTGAIILACVREQPIGYVENSNGLRYNHAGGLYRIVASGT